MAALNFPGSPTNGQTYTANGKTWTWNGTQWVPVIVDLAYTGTLTGGTGIVNIGSGQIYKDTSGNVGIGTSSPGRKLHLYASGTCLNLESSSTNVYFQLACNGQTNAQSGYIGYNSTSDLLFLNNDTERLRITADGNVGIGNSADNNTRRLYFSTVSGGTCAIESITLGATNQILSFRTTFSIEAERARLASDSFVLRQSSNAANTSVSFNTTIQNALTLDSSGWLGIGATSVSFPLHILSSSAQQLAGFVNSGSNVNTWIGVGSATSSVNLGVNSTNVPYLYSINGFDFLISGGNVLVKTQVGLGYGTGAGGAVTQTTSRTTAPPTINTPSGAITLVSAAGSTTWSTFTVTNSVVAATDTIIINQKTGTDLYEIHVTNVANGSFKVSFRTTGGTTTEQPVFNFAVIKGTAS